MFKILISLAIALGVSAVAYASAASLIVNGNSLQLRVVAAVSAVPEPTGAVLAAAVLLLPAIRRRYKLG